jgi:hypothetical protein
MLLPPLAVLAAVLVTICAQDPTFIVENDGLSVSVEPEPPTDALFQGVHAAYYLWYGNPQTDGKYFHWNHEV